MFKLIRNWGPWILAGIGMWLLGQSHLLYTHHNIYLIGLLLLSLLVVLLTLYNTRKK